MSKALISSIDVYSPFHLGDYAKDASVLAAQ